MRASVILADPHRNGLVAFAMRMVSQSDAEFNLLGEWICNGDPNPVCPVCQSPMKHRDWRRRHIRKEGGEKCWGKIRRLYCEKCHRLHNELPSCLSPYKHYDVEVIEGVVDDVTASDIADTEDHPCEKTMERWKAWVEHNRPFIEGYIRSVGYRVLGLGEAFLKACGSVLDWMRETYHDNERHWLTMVNRIAYNTGSSLEPWPPFWSSSAP